MKSDTGIELLMHIGLDTVELKGKPYDVKVKANQRVKKGDLLVLFMILLTFNTQMSVK